jgi:hypothetical protein
MCLEVLGRCRAASSSSHGEIKDLESSAWEITLNLGDLNRTPSILSVGVMQLRQQEKRVDLKMH